LPETADGPSLLELCRELAYRMLAHCNFCQLPAYQMGSFSFSSFDLKSTRILLSL
jgi:hypothetical protein